MTTRHSPPSEALTTSDAPSRRSFTRAADAARVMAYLERLQLPSTMVEVEAQLGDVPDDTENPLFKRGFGLSYRSWGLALAWPQLRSSHDTGDSSSPLVRLVGD